MSFINARLALFTALSFSCTAVIAEPSKEQGAYDDVIDMGLVTEDGTVITDKEKERKYLESYESRQKSEQFLPTIIGKKKSAVDKIIGKPDGQCSGKKQRLECSYQSGGIKVTYIRNRADWITLIDPENSSFNSYTLSQMGISCPSVFDAQLIYDDGFRWVDACKNLHSVSMWPGPSGGADYRPVKRIEIKTTPP